MTVHDFSGRRYDAIFARTRRLLGQSVKAVNPTVVYFGLVVALFGFILLMGYYNRPISDNFSYANASVANPLQVAVDGYTGGNGRIGQYIAFSLYNSVFGFAKAVMVAPIINTLLLAVALGLLSYVLLSRYNQRSKSVLRDSVLLGAVSSLVLVFSTRSIFDSSLWLDSSGSYIGSLILLVLNVALFLHLLFRKSGGTILSLVSLGLSVLIGQQFSEPTSIIVIVGFALALLIAVIRKKWKAVKLTTVGFLSSMAGMMVIYLSPGSQARRVAAHSELDLQGVLFGSLERFQSVLELVTSWRFFLFLALGVLMFYTLRRLRPSNKTLAASAGISVALMLVPYYLLFMVVEYSTPGYIALRTYQVPAALAAIGVASIVAIACFMIQRVAKPKDHVWAVVVLISVVLAFGASFKPLATIVKAEAVRSIQYDYREVSIRQQLASGATTITVLPAPLLLSDTEPAELIYSNQQIDWFVASFKTYYGLNDKQLVISAKQTSVYCLSGQSASWWNISSCETLRLDSSEPSIVK